MKHPIELQEQSQSCSRTYATLCVYHDAADPNEVTSLLRLRPDRAHKVGDSLTSNRKAAISGWFLGTKDVCSSKDLQIHIKWILKRLNKKDKELQKLSVSGYKIWIFCFWESIHGNGGPVLDHKVIMEIAKLPVSLYFDIWFTCNKKNTRDAQGNKGRKPRKLMGAVLNKSGNNRQIEGNYLKLE